MSKLHLIDLGYVEPTVVYELKPVKLAELKNASIAEIISKLQTNGIDNLLIDSGQPREIEEFVIAGFNVLKGRVPKVAPTNTTEDEK